MAGGICIPLGKYKGRPLDEIAFLDPDYFDWLQQQTNLLQRYPTLAKGLTELGVSGDQTPIHNAIQALFLDDSVCLRLVNRLWGERLTQKLRIDLLADSRRIEVSRILNAHDGYISTTTRRKSLLFKCVQSRLDDVELRDTQLLDNDELVLACRKLVPSKTALSNIFSSDASLIRAELTKRIEGAKCTLSRARDELREMRVRLTAIRSRYDTLSETELRSRCQIDLRNMEEPNGSDVHFRVRIEAALPDQHFSHSSYRRVFDTWVEVKPYVSDDYPSVLRQLKTQKKLASTISDYETKFVVVIGTYGGQGASLPQVRQIFNESGFDLVLLEEIGCEMPVVAKLTERDMTLPLFAS